MYNEMAIGRKSVATVNKEAHAACKFLGPVGGKKTLDHMFQLWDTDTALNIGWSSGTVHLSRSTQCGNRSHHLALGTVAEVILSSGR